MTSNFDETYGTMVQPEEIKIPMKPHQLSILKAAIKLETEQLEFEDDTSKMSLKTKFGVLCDNVGSGKSLEMLSIIAHEKSCRKKVDKNYSLENMLSMTIDHKEEVEDVVLPLNIIVVPHTIISQWCDYISNYTTLTYYQINSKKTIDEFNTHFDDHSKNDILLVASTRYREFDVLWMMKCDKLVSRLIFDEADVIRIPKITEIPASFYWFMTSSFLALQNPYGIRQWVNHLGEINTYYNYDQGFTYKVQVAGITNTGFILNMFRNLHKCRQKAHIHSAIFLKNNDDYIKKSFQLQSPEIIKIICKNPVILNILDTIVNAETVAMINAGNIQGAMENMNCYKVEHSNLIETVTQDLEIELKNKKIEYQMKSQMTYSSIYAKKQSLDKIEQVIDTIESKIKLLIDRIHDHDMCGVCFDSIDNKTILNCCHSAYCFECVSTWLNTKNICPHCRSNITSENLLIVSDSIKSEVKTPKEEHETKFNKLTTIIKERKEELGDTFKFLVFTEHEILFNDLMPFLAKHKLNSAQIKGTGTTINKQVAKFKATKEHDGDDVTDCLLLNARFCGNGLNLENATDVFIYHSMSKEMTNQVIGRAQRPGRTTTLKVWHMCYENEA